MTNKKRISSFLDISSSMIIVWPKKAFTLLSDLHSSSIKSFSSVILATIRFDLSDLYLQWFFKCNQVQPISRSFQNCGNPQILHSRKSRKPIRELFWGVFFSIHPPFWASLFEKSFFPHQKIPINLWAPFGALSTGQNPQDDAGPGLTAGCAAWLLMTKSWWPASLLPKSVVFGWFWIRVLLID